MDMNSNSKQKSRWNDIYKLKNTIKQRPANLQIPESKSETTNLQIRTSLTENMEILPLNQSEKHYDNAKDKDFQKTIEKLQTLRRTNDLQLSKKMFFSVVSKLDNSVHEPLKTYEEKRPFEDLVSPLSDMQSALNSEKKETMETAEIKIAFLESILKESNISYNYDNKTWSCIDLKSRESNVASKKAIIELKKQIKTMEREHDKTIKQAEENSKKQMFDLAEQYEERIKEIMKENELICSMKHSNEEIQSQLGEYRSQADKNRALSLRSPSSSSKGTINVRSGGKHCDEVVVS